MPTAVEVSEIHAYPLRSRGFEEPLFPTTDSKRAIAEHLLQAPWLTRAAELEGCTGEAAHAFEEPVELRKFRGRVEVVRSQARGRYPRRERAVRVLDRWREVWGWWDENRCVDRVVFRLLLSGGSVVEVARERSGGWLLVGVVD
ncbi:MAG: hypothetical protein M3N18_03290 [Actinomycetota bacterium]|nr:hypothetical protein [Actinomycetota bacterium]